MKILKEVVRVVHLSGKWIPAIQNGHKVRSYKRVPISINRRRRLGAQVWRGIAAIVNDIVVRLHLEQRRIRRFGVHTYEVYDRGLPITRIPGLLSELVTQISRRLAGNGLAGL